MADYRIKLIKGFQGRKDDQIATAHSLGLRKIGDVTIQPDNEATKGKIAKIAHLIEVTEA
ncbi:50S ribosomal protein L30 [Acetanaerobacterium sp. MSJ-12]|uniref:Large ribosomal subunit protein uL30 n=1 Tax=Bittarella massiliensis (ex Durand et al. 2017) TaxID=1720313 RepID=A0AAQ1MFH8_9FIRM|nr:MULTISPECIES: 50S ribosomal protein L30 [Eubacteriales]MCB5942004.1 50S ribosomal protein L30 [bacterium 210820-DFI.6.52]ERI98422.1 ribosomal protein L30 [Clostridium sp. ATCC 29733]MBC2871307.1 50S ribosomal protein L30 [Bittarella massiliensis (ex Durand et al. 2017)]MBU5419195.1 50S ribosomal protein L30 [Acetanaerobacterium sp. MSJ-12]MCQ4949410.1 50S ribosomal protein L30 [Bittarella massiliensis (ex Durand et al. 2017)]